MCRTTFCLALIATCWGQANPPSHHTVTSAQSHVQQTEAIATVPFDPKDKGEPDSTMSGTTRSGLRQQINLPNLS